MAHIRVSTQLGGVRIRANDLVARGQHALVNQVHADANIYAPLLSSDMRTQSVIAPDNKSISWNTPYARRQYYNLYRNYTTPGTGPKWDQKAKSVHWRDWLRIVEASMK